MKPDLHDKKVVILADGIFPVHHSPLSAIDTADFIVCCDGAARKLLTHGRVPDLITGDIDSLDSELRQRFHDRIVVDLDQESNDLTKAVKWSMAHHARSLVITGATGRGEDHTLGNISLLLEYGRMAEVKMISDSGTFFPLFGTCRLKTRPGQRISMFSPDSNMRISAAGLSYPVRDLLLDNWWRATLNTAAGDSVEIEFDSGRLLVFLGHLD